MLSSARYSPSLGGVQTHAREIATRLNRSHDVTVVTSNPGLELPGADVIDGVTINRVKTWPASGDPFIPWGWVKQLKSLQPDVVILDGYQSVVSAWALMSTIRHDIPLIVVYHEGANANGLRQALYPLQRRVLARWFRRARFTVATAPHEVELYQKELSLNVERLKYIPNGADMPTPAVRPEVDPWHLVSIGRLERQKRHHIVIDALAQIRTPETPWHLTVIGRGEEQSVLTAQAADLDIADAVQFRSFDQHERALLAGTLQSAHLVIAPSLYETHPMAVIEAAALGCHVLVPAEGNEGVVGLARRGIVEAVPSFDANQFVSSIRVASTTKFTPNLEELVTWDDAADEFDAMIQQIASEKE